MFLSKGFPLSAANYTHKTHETMDIQLPTLSLASPTFADRYRNFRSVYLEPLYHSSLQESP